MNREQALKLIYRHTHRDYKGTTKGDKSILINRGGTMLVPLSELTDAEIAEALPYAERKEAQRGAKK